MADRFNKSLAGIYDNVSQLAAMDQEGLDIAVLFRTSPLHTNENFEPEYANDLCARHGNDWMADFCKADPKRLKASALITLHDVNLAVPEAKRAVKNGAVGLSLCPEPINGRQIHDRHFDPIWAAAQEMDIPICFLPPARPQQPQVSRDRFEGHPNQHLLAAPEIKRVEDLRGKKVAVAHRGSVTFMFARAILQAHGLEVDKDVTMLALGRPDVR